MKTRGKTSAEARELAILAEPVDRMARPDAPYDLTDEQVEEWRAIVNRMPADWFPRESHAALSQLCRVTVRCRRIAQMAQRMEDTPGLDLEAYQELVKTEAALSRTVTSLMTKLRLTQQSTWDEKKKKPVLLERPWVK